MKRFLSRFAKSGQAIKSTRLKTQLPPGVLNRLKIYNYYVWMTYDALTHDSNGGSLQSLKRLARSRPRILFYPDVPWEASMMYQFCLLMGYAITNDVTLDFDLAVKWRSATYIEPVPILDRLARGKRVLNLRCNDISKAHVDQVFCEIFAYSPAIDPLTYHGRFVQKSNWNATHDGKIIEGPVLKADRESVYQMVIDNRVNDDLVMDMRVPVMGCTIPLVMLYFRPVTVRFSAEIAKIEIVEAGDVLTHVEQQQIFAFCDSLGLDCGELDVLRHRGDGRIYIVDANTTPHGPPTHLGLRKDEMKRLATAFDRSFVGSAVVRGIQGN
jgi:hypothetical protein